MEKKKPAPKKKRQKKNPTPKPKIKTNQLKLLWRLKSGYPVTLITINNIAKFPDIIFIDLSLFPLDEGWYPPVNLQVVNMMAYIYFIL